MILPAVAEVGKKIWAPFYTQNEHVTKTGLGQTSKMFEKRVAFSLQPLLIFVILLMWCVRACAEGRKEETP
jgi:hypothetical protein